MGIHVLDRGFQPRVLPTLVSDHSHGIMFSLGRFMRPQLLLTARHVQGYMHAHYACHQAHARTSSVCTSHPNHAHEKHVVDWYE